MESKDNRQNEEIRNNLQTCQPEDLQDMSDTEVSDTLTDPESPRSDVLQVSGVREVCNQNADETEHTRCVESPELQKPELDSRVQATRSAYASDNIRSRTSPDEATSYLFNACKRRRAISTSDGPTYFTEKSQTLPKDSPRKCNDSLYTQSDLLSRESSHLEELTEELLSEKRARSNLDSPLASETSPEQHTKSEDTVTRPEEGVGSCPVRNTSRNSNRQRNPETRRTLSFLRLFHLIRQCEENLMSLNETPKSSGLTCGIEEYGPGAVQCMREQYVRESRLLALVNRIFKSAQSSIIRPVVQLFNRLRGTKPCRRVNNSLKSFTEPHMSVRTKQNDEWSNHQAQTNSAKFSSRSAVQSQEENNQPHLQAQINFPEPTLTLSTVQAQPVEGNMQSQANLTQTMQSNVQQPSSAPFQPQVNHPIQSHLLVSVAQTTQQSFVADTLHVHSEVQDSPDPLASVQGVTAQVLRDVVEQEETETSHSEHEE